MARTKRGMNLRFRTVALVAVLLSLTAAALAREIRTDYDHNVGFAQYKTYS